MKPAPPDFAELYQIWMRIRNKMNIMEDLPRDFGVDDLLHLSEIHTIQAIGKTPENNIRIIAGILGVTPSAASQVISRLTKRGLVKKVRGLRNEKEISLELTKKGLVAFLNHEQVHARMYEQVAGRIGPLSDKERAVLNRIFSAFESVYDERITDLMQARDSRQQEQSS
jgi:DNA-binding MarR family transcriptional regulator